MALLHGDLTLMADIARVAQKLKSYDPEDPRLRSLREYYAAAKEHFSAPRNLSREWLAEWEAFLGIGPKPLRARPPGQNCDRCDQKALPVSSQEVDGYGFRATCTQCGEAWVVRFNRREKATGASTPQSAI